MALFDYNELAEVVTEILEEFGQQCLWRKTVATGPARNPTGQTVTDYPVTIVFLNNKQQSLFTLLSTLQGMEIPAGGFYALMGPVTFTPELTDTIFRSEDDTGEKLGIADKNGIEAVQPDSTQSVLLYKLSLVR